MIEFLALVCLLFPVGIWLGLEGYELPALIFLLLGWVPVSACVADFLANHRKGKEHE